MIFNDNEVRDVFSVRVFTTLCQISGRTHLQMGMKVKDLVVTLRFVSERLSVRDGPEVEGTLGISARRRVGISLE